MPNDEISTIVDEHSKKGYGKLTIQHYLKAKGFDDKDIEESLATTKSRHPRINMKKHVNQFLTAAILLFLIVVLLFGFYMLYFGK